MIFFWFILVALFWAVLGMVFNVTPFLILALGIILLGRVFDRLRGNI